MADVARIEASFQSRYWHFSFLDQNECPPDLLTLLRDKLAHIPADNWPERLAWGGAYINGLQARSNAALQVPVKVEYYEPKFDIAAAHEYFPPFDPAYIVYEDGDVVVSYKPAGLPCMPAKEQQQFCLKSYVEKALGLKVHMPSRIDMSTQGLVVISKSERMNPAIQKIFEHRRISKQYLLRVACEPAWESVTCIGQIGKSREHPVLRQVVEHGGKQATTLLRKLKPLAQGDFLLEAQPLTGRTHQIRVHASDLGLPIVGDNFYGGRPAARLSLLSYRLTFQHPFENRLVDVKVPDDLMPEWAQA